MSAPTDDPSDFAACDDHESTYPIGGSCPNCEAKDLASAQAMAQSSADNDGRRWLAARLTCGSDEYAAAATLADLGPAGSNTTRRDREGSVRMLVEHAAGLAREAGRLRERLDHVSSALRGSTKERKRLRGERDNARRWADGEPGAVRDW